MEIQLKKHMNGELVIIDKNGKEHFRKTTRNSTFRFNKTLYFYNKEQNKIELFTGTAANIHSPGTVVKSEEVVSEFDINERFDFLGNFVNMVIENITASLLVTGEGGLGKTHTVREKLKEAGLEEDIDYKIIKGYSTPKALYATLYENSDSLVIFDDCDSVLKDPNSLNLLKGALDSYDKRTISWLSKGFISDELPNSFDFTGRVIFISNLSLTKVDGAVKSRTISVDLTMTLEDKIKRMRSIISEIVPVYSMNIKNKVLDFLDKNKENAKEFNMRTLEKSIKVFNYYVEQGNEEEGYNAIKYLLVNV